MAEALPQRLHLEGKREGKMCKASKGRNNSMFRGRLIVAEKYILDAIIAFPALD